jgi:hypothetical protein
VLFHIPQSALTGAQIAELFSNLRRHTIYLLLLEISYLAFGRVLFKVESARFCNTIGMPRTILRCPLGKAITFA